MRVLVTGGAGFIGRHLTAALLARDIGVTILDVAARPPGVPDRTAVAYCQGSVLDEGLVDRLVGAADLVVHLAGIAEPMRYGSDSLQTMDVNLLGSINVVRRCADRSVPVLFSSTSEVYGTNPDIPWSENADRVLGPVANVRWCYSTAKAAVEHYLDACRRQLGLDYLVVRLFNTYGVGLRGRVVDGFIRSALAGTPLRLHGDGEQTRCFCYVDDVVDALMRIILRPIAGGRTYNVGACTETRIVDLARLIVDLTRSRSRLDRVPHAELFDGFQDVPRRRPDIAAVRRDFGWEPSTALATGLQRTIAAMRDAREASAVA